MSATSAPASFVTPPVPPQPRGPVALLGDGMRRRGGRRALSLIWIVLLLSGVGMFAYPFATDLYTGQYQHRLRSEFNSPNYALEYRMHRIKVGAGLTQLRIPKIGVDVLVVQGTTPSALRAGAGHYLNTPLPGEKGNVGIAGHRTTFGRPFNRLDELGPGDVVYLDTPLGTYTYTAVASFDARPNPHPVAPNDVSVLAQPANGYWLTLTTCNPKGSAAERLILRLKLTAKKLIVLKPKAPAISDKK